MYDFLANIHPNIEGLTLTYNVKEAILLNLYNYMKSKRLKIPVDCEELIRQLQRFQRIQDKNGRVRYEAPLGGHDDYVVPLAPAVASSFKTDRLK